MKPRALEELTFKELARSKDPSRRAFLRDIVVGSGGLLLFNRFLVRQVHAQTKEEKTVFSMIVVDFNKGTGFRTCETACSSFNRRETVNGRDLSGLGNPTYSNIRVYSYNPDVDIPITCLMCDDAPCVEACPVDPDPKTGWKALYRDGKLPVVRNDTTRCIGCGSCAEACRTKRVGAFIPNSETNKPERMCTLCGGDPQCIKLCPYGALSYVVEGTNGKHYGFSPDLAMTYVTATRGACHLNSSTVRGQNDYAGMDSLGLCMFATDGFGKHGLRRLLTKITGTDWTEEEYLKAGERIFNLERAFNAREGFTRADDPLPARFFDDPLTTGPGKGAVLKRDELEKKLTEYYRDRGWDEKTGRPTPAKLNSLGLETLL